MLITAQSLQIPGWFQPPHGIEEIRRVYGAIIVAGEEIIRPPHWESANMTRADVGHRVYVNRLVLPILIETLRQCHALGDGFEVKTIGCFAPRSKRTSGSLSLHSWGVAVDLNADENPPMHVRSAADLARRRKTIPDAWVSVFKAIGWTWGGDFDGYWDPQHFQWASGY